MDNQKDTRLEWVVPTVKQIDAGAAESQRATITDGGGGNQAS